MGTINHLIMHDRASTQLDEEMELVILTLQTLQMMLRAFSLDLSWLEAVEVAFFLALRSRFCAAC